MHRAVAVLAAALLALGGALSCTKEAPAESESKSTPESAPAAQPAPAEAAPDTSEAQAPAPAESAAPAAPPSQPTTVAASSSNVQINPAFLAMYPAAPKVIDHPENPRTDAKVNLGRMLYYDTRLSKNQDISCNTCHQLDKYGVDGKPTSPGHKGQLGTRNSPTVYFAAAHIAQFWDGREPNVEEQAKKPILNPIEMAMPSEQAVIDVLKSIPQYVDAFKAAFPGQNDPLTYDNLGKAIGAFERGLTTLSRWDKFVGGDKNALTDAEKQGFNDFIMAQCMTCHIGPYFGGNMYQKLGLVKPWPSQKDQGRYEVTKSSVDKMMFKVPSLRNVTKTAPYFHDGSQPDLKEAIRMMARHQSGRELTDAQVQSIATFLDALTGEIDQEYIKKPDLPPSTDKTPKPDPS